MIYDDQTSSAMNYYEELGISQEATEQEIRKAHRRLVKLMHPDAQPDQNLKMLAETQMRRLNSIVSTLLDADQRRSYDQQLHAAHAGFRQASHSRPPWLGIPWWLASALGAVVLALGAVWVWADHMDRPTHSRSSSTTYNIPPENPPTAALPRTSTTASPDPDNSKPLGASYTAPSVVTSQPPPSISDQPKSSDQHSGISATVVTDPPPVAPAPLAPTAAKQIEPAAKAPPVQKTDPKKSQSVVVVENHPAPPVIKPMANKAAAIPAPSKPAPKIAETKQAVKTSDTKVLVAKAVQPSKPAASFPPKHEDVPAPKKTFSLPPGTLIARAMPAGKAGGSQLPPPPRVATQLNRDYNSSTLPGSTLPTATPPSMPQVTAAASGAGAMNYSRDPLEGEWVYAPKEPERHRAGFYPPEFIDLKLFGSGDPGSLKGQYSAKYVVTDRPVSPEVSFELASSAKGSRKFLWQSNNGAKGTLNIDTIDDRTIRVDWHTTTAVRGPALTSGTATLVRRQ